MRPVYPTPAEPAHLQAPPAPSRRNCDTALAARRADDLLGPATRSLIALIDRLEEA